MGGKSPLVIMDDADLDLAISCARNASFFNHGQCCIAGTRVYVHQNIYDKFI